MLNIPSKSDCHIQKYTNHNERELHHMYHASDLISTINCIKRNFSSAKDIYYKAIKKPKPN